MGLTDFHGPREDATHGCPRPSSKSTSGDVEQKPSVPGFKEVAMTAKRIFVIVAAALMTSLVSGTGIASSPQATGALVSVGSPTGIHQRNAQNEPGLAVDASRPDVLAAGANDLVDMQPCSKKAANTAAACSFPLGTFNLGVGLAGVYFSF